MLSQPPLFKSVGALAGMRAKAPGMAPVRPPAISRSAGLSAPGGACGRGASLVSCTPRTGRTHQIRVHLAAAGHPILGDDIYGALVCHSRAAPCYEALVRV